MYQSNAELPDYVQRALPDAEQSIFRDAYNKTGQLDQAWRAVEDSENVRWFSCWASIQKRDLQGEMMSIDGLKEAMPYYLARGGPVYYGHKAAEIGTAFRGEATNHPERNLPAIKLKCACYRDTEFADMAWAGIKNGDYPDVSIGGSALRQTWKCDNDSCYNFVEKMDWFDTSVVRKGANPGASILDINLKAKYDQLAAYLDSNPSNEELVDKCPLCNKIHSTLAKSLGEAYAYRKTREIAEALAGDTTMANEPPIEGPQEPPVEKCNEAAMVKKDDDVTDGLLQKVLAMFAQLSKKMDDMMQTSMSPEGQGIENAVDGMPPEAAAEAGEEMPQEGAEMADKPPEGGEAKEAPAEGEKPAEEQGNPNPDEGNDMEEKPQEQPQEKSAEQVQAEAEEKVKQVKQMKEKAEQAATTPRPGMAPQPPEMFAKREIDWDNPDFLKSLGQTPMRDAIRGKFKGFN